MAPFHKVTPPDTHSCAATINLVFLAGFLLDATSGCAVGAERHVGSVEPGIVEQSRGSVPLGYHRYRRSEDKTFPGGRDEAIRELHKNGEGIVSGRLFGLYFLLSQRKKSTTLCLVFTLLRASF